MYIRTKESVLEKEKSNIGKQYKLDIINKDNGSIIDTLICDYVEDKSCVFDIIYAEYLITHHLDARNYNRKLEIIDNSLIIKQADTIEELCDEFIVYVKDNKLLTNLGSFENCYNWYNELKNRKGVSKVDVSMLGAIWTDKGLIYVAKMNEKGKLELL